MSMKPIMERYAAAARQGDAESCAEWTGGKLRLIEGLRSEATFGRHTIVIDEPTDFGGTDTAPNPAEIALAGLGASIQVTFRAYADWLEIPVEGISVELSGNLDHRGFFGIDPSVRAGFDKVDVKVELRSRAAQDDIQRLLRHVEAHCPVLDTLRAATPVELAVITSKV